MLAVHGAQAPASGAPHGFAQRAGRPKSRTTATLAPLQLRGSKSVEQANDKFTATMTNVVRWREAAEGGSSGDDSSSSSDSGSAAGCREICSETSLRVELEVPGWFIIPVGAIEKTGAEQAGCGCA